MAITKLKLENFTVFHDLDLEFSQGINVFIGENGTGKTHVMKVLYSACKAAQKEKTAMDFATKIVRVFRPDGLSFFRLAKRGSEGHEVHVIVQSDHSELSLTFAPPKETPHITGMEKWEKEFSPLTSTYIPAKEILSNAKNLIHAMINPSNELEFDDTYLDIIAAASVGLGKGLESDERDRYLRILQEIAQGHVKIENEKFYLMSAEMEKLEFHLVAEGLRKIALLWQLIKNGTLKSGSFLFWDEPEANLNPKHIPALVDILYHLQQSGIQIFLATHDYVLAKYLEIRRPAQGAARFHSLYKVEKKKPGTTDGQQRTNTVIERESGDTFKELKHNDIADARIKLSDEVFSEKRRG